MKTPCLLLNQPILEIQKNRALSDSAILSLLKPSTTEDDRVSHRFS